MYSPVQKQPKPFEKLFDWARPKKKYVYFFSEGSLEERNILGNKGANLCEMHRIGVAVPPGFVISSECCLDFLKYEGTAKLNKLNEQLIGDYKKALRDLEMQTGRRFGGEPGNKDTWPLLLSVRSGAAVSMPGMMQTVLNVGMNDDIVDAMVQCSMNPKWAYDTYRRFLQMYGNVVLNMDQKPYEDILNEARRQRDVAADSELNEHELREVVRQFKLLVQVPEDPWEQLQLSIEAVFRSWNSPRAVKYRDINNIASDWGTAVTIQSMVYGNLNIYSGSGVAFTRNPVTGVKEIYGEYLPEAAGEDVVSGVRTPKKVQDLEQEQHSVYESLCSIMRELEKHYRDMQDIEFTIENKTLYILQTRTGKRTARAAVSISVAMVKEKAITEREALLRIDANQMDFFLHAMIDHDFANPDDPKVRDRILGKGLAASAGAAIGRVVFTCEQAEEARKAGTPAILVRHETSADDIGGLKAAEGVLTLRGGLTSHAAVVMRGMGKSAVVGAKKFNLDLDAGTLCSSDNPNVCIRLHDIITIDGSTGFVYQGEMPTVSVGQDNNFMTVMQWADKYKKLDVLANAESREDVQYAHRMGAEGIGLCRTEHMFFEPHRIDLFRRMILSETSFDRSRWLLQMLPMQQQDFLEIFRLMGDTQVTIRLLDPPLHEFLPNAASPTFEQEIQELAERVEVPLEVVQRRVMALHESNPMLGFRGCRLGIVYPEITEMQTKAIVGAAIQARQENIAVRPQIMIPLVCTDHEIDLITPIIWSAASAVCSQSGGNYSMDSLECTLGAMIETPRACIRADRIAQAKWMDFISIGSNDLTQLVFGFSRDDCQQFMPTYLERHLIAHDPFETLDDTGVGGMIQLTVRRARIANPHFKVGVCGEHGADPKSIEFFNRQNISYVSCSPYRIPIAKVAAAQAHIQQTATPQPTDRVELFKKLVTGEVSL